MVMPFDRDSFIKGIFVGQAMRTCHIKKDEYYGVEWGRVASPVWTRVGLSANFPNPVPYVGGMSAGDYGSPFDSIYPWSGMVRVSDPEAGELVRIPKFYYRWVNNAAKMRLEIRGTPANGYHTSPAHMDRGDGHGERDFAYIGRYHCASDYKSKSGVTPKVRITKSAARTGIHNLGSSIWQMDHAMWWTIDMLYLVEFANANCQQTIGYGCGDGNYIDRQAMGYTDSMPYHTGTMFSSKTTYGVSTQYRNIEGLWDNCTDWCDGIYFRDTRIYHILNPSEFSDNIGGVATGTRAARNGYITGFTFPQSDRFAWAGYPESQDVASFQTDGTEYFCDYARYEYYGNALCVGGSGSIPNNTYGLFFRDGYARTSDPSFSIGARLMTLP